MDKFTEKQVDGLTSIVILSYNRPQNLQRNIESLYQTTTAPFEVIIFDNNSPDTQTHQLLNELEGTTKPDGNGLIKIIRNSENVGCSAGRQQALTCTRGEYIVTMDDDMTYTKGWLDALHTRLNQDPQIAAAMCKTVFPNGVIQWNGGYIEQEHGRLVNFEPIDFYKNENDPTISGEVDCDWIGGGATIIRRSIAQRVEHKSKEIYLNGYEDYDYALQLRKLGYRLVNCPTSTVYHHHAGHDLKDVAKIMQENPAYFSARKNKVTLLNSLLRFFEQTGLCLIREFKGSKLYRAMEQSLEGKDATEIEHLCLEEMGNRGFSVAAYPTQLVEKRTICYRKQRERIKKIYNLTENDLANPKKELFKRIVGTYTSALQRNTEQIDLEEVTDVLYNTTQEWRKALDQNSPDTNYFFNIEDGTITSEGIYSLIERLKETWIPFQKNKEEYDWAPRYILEKMVRAELQYVIATDPSEKKKKELTETRDCYKSATGEIKKGNFIGAIKLYDQVLSLAPNYHWAIEDKKEAERNLPKQFNQNLAILQDPKSLQRYPLITQAKENITAILQHTNCHPQYVHQAQTNAYNLFSQRQYDLAEEIALTLVKAQPDNNKMWELIGDAVLSSNTATRPDRISWAQECYQKSKKRP